MSSLVISVLGFVAAQGDFGWGDTYFTGEGVARSEISWAPQQPSLVSGSILANISLGSEVEPNLDLIQQACVLAACEDIDLNLTLGVAGSGLSGGQAQRVALARAYFRMLTSNTPILVLDEPTSALDSVTESRVIKGIATFAERGNTVIVVSHRPAVIEAADSVVEVTSVTGEVIA